MIEADLSQRNSNSPVYKKVRNQREFLKIFFGKGGNLDTDNTHGEHHVKMEAEIGVVLPKANEYQ